MKKYLYILLLLTVFFSCNKAEEKNRVPMRVVVNFKAVIGNEPLEFGKNYINSLGEDIKFSEFKFYVYDVRVDGNSVGEEGHHLVDFKNSEEEYTVSGIVPDEKFSELSFVLGVDSARNYSGAQTGALDPLHGMFWTWSTGYIMAKMEGVSTFANTPGNVLEYHIGGFSGEQNVTKKISFNLPAYQLSEFRPLVINVYADALKWFGGTDNINIAANPVSMTPGPLAVSIAKNYYNMFTVEIVQ